MTSFSRLALPEGIPVRLSNFVTTGEGRIMNLSASGAYVATDMFLLPQARVRLQVVLHEEKRWIETDAIVVWENRASSKRPNGLRAGYGVRFVDLDADSEAVISRVLGLEISPPEASSPISEPFAAIDPPSPVDLGAVADEPDVPPFPLRREVVVQKADELPGVFVLSYDRTQEARVGRTDTDLQATLSSLIGMYAYFYAEVIEKDDERYLRECELYHRLGGDRGQLDNTDHPSPPPSVEIRCPACVNERVH
ncbi:MAG TPA: PilZ domain-containing protein [Vicinamibacteria bacterium]|nr:PilZ domain-containing protein [Vicinamibacteria bacterium]